MRGGGTAEVVGCCDDAWLVGRDKEGVAKEGCKYSYFTVQSHSSTYEEDHPLRRTSIEENFVI